MTKRAFFVIGAEGSGTRMMTRALTLAGVVEDYDKWDFGNQPDFNVDHPLIVVHRSLPHGQAWPDLRKIERSLFAAKYQVIPVLMIREINATVQSQIKRGYVDTYTDGEKKVRWALSTAVNQLPNFIFVSYEAFCLSDGFRKWLFTERFQLPETTINTSWFANEKYYAEEKK